MTFGSLFAGIGGFDLGLERAGMECAWQVEIENFPRRVLEAHWPGLYRPLDVCDVGGENLDPVDLICGGFPCQDLSVAGKRAGLAGERSGLFMSSHLSFDELTHPCSQSKTPESFVVQTRRDMGAVLRTLQTRLVRLPCADAQFFGVAQDTDVWYCLVGCLEGAAVSKGLLSQKAERGFSRRARKKREACLHRCKWHWNKPHGRSRAGALS